MRKISGDIVKKCAKIFVKKMQCWDRRQNHFWVRKKISRNFSHFSGQAVCSALLEAVRFVTHGTHFFRGAVGTGAGVCIPPLTVSMFPDWGTSMYTCAWIALASLAPLVLASCWSNRWFVVENPWRCAFFWISQKSVKNSILFFTPCFCRPPQDKVRPITWAFLRDPREARQLKP